MEKGDKGSTMIRMGVSGWMFLLVPAYPGCPGSKAVKRSLLLLCGTTRSAGTRKVKPICILLKQETVSDTGISWAICKSALHSRQIATPAPHHSVFLQAGCPSCRPTNSVKALKATTSLHCASWGLLTSVQVSLAILVVWGDGDSDVVQCYHAIFRLWY